MAERNLLDHTLETTLLGGDRLLQGTQPRASSDIHTIGELVSAWAQATRRPISECLLQFETMIRSEMVMSLLPGKALDGSYAGSIESAIDEHVAEMGVALSRSAVGVLESICINVNKFRGLTGKAVRAQSMSIGRLKIDVGSYQNVRRLQCDRCYWCGVELSGVSVIETLDHLVPKHLGDDPPSQQNWVIACRSCNLGKDDAMTWATHDHVSGFLRHAELQDSASISLAARWVVLGRDRKCSRCQTSPCGSELRVRRRLPTGLSIPPLCESVCLTCCVADDVLPKVLWDAKEAGRA